MAEVTNRDLYEAIGELRGEFTGAIQRLDDKFMNLEAGRLTRLEGKMTDFEVSQIKKDSIIQQNQAVLSTKFIIIGAISIAVFNSLLYGLLTKVLT